MLEYCAKGSLLNILNAKLTLPDEEWHIEVFGYLLQMVEAVSFSKLAQIQSTKAESSTAISSLRTCWSTIRDNSRSSTSTSHKCCHPRGQFESPISSSAPRATPHPSWSSGQRRRNGPAGKHWIFGHWASPCWNCCNADTPFR